MERAYIDKLEGKVSGQRWSLHTQIWEHEKGQLQRFLITDRQPNIEILYTVKELLELLQVIPQLWDTRNNFERRELVDLLYSNCQLNSRSLCLQNIRAIYINFISVYSTFLLVQALICIYGQHGSSLSLET